MTITVRPLLSYFFTVTDVAQCLFVDISSVSLVDESSVLIENTGLKQEQLDEKAVV